MALGNVSVYSPMGENQPSSWTFRTDAGSTAIYAGEPVKVSGNYVTVLADAEPTSTNKMLGIAATSSTHTASLDGVVDVIPALPGLVFQCAATTPGNMNTDAELLDILNDRVAFDLAAGVYTVDENQGDTSTNGLRIVGGDISTGMVYFMVQESCTDLYV